MNGMPMTLLNRVARKVSAFFLAVGKSCYDMEWYREVRGRKPARAFAYVALMLGLVSLVSGLLLTPVVRGHVRDARSIVTERVPDDASFSVENGAFSTSLEPATEITVGDFTFVLDQTYEEREPPDAFDGRIGVYVGRNAAIYQDNLEWRAFGFSNIEDVTFTKADMLAWIDGNGRTIVFVAVAVFIVVQFFALLFASLLFALLGAVAVMLMGRLSGTPLPFGVWYACGLHALTLPTIVDTFATHAGMDFPLAYPVLFFMIMLSVLIDERASPVLPPAPSPTA